MLTMIAINGNFYQQTFNLASTNYLTKSSTWYNIRFHNNSAKKGGNHIYGAFMHSSDCHVALGDSMIMMESFQVVAHKGISIMNPNQCLRSLLTQ